MGVMGRLQNKQGKETNIELNVLSHQMAENLEHFLLNYVPESQEIDFKDLLEK